MEIKIFGRQVLSIKKEPKVETEPKIPELKLRTPRDKVQAMPEYTSDGYPTGTFAEGLGHARQAVHVILHGGESNVRSETALFRLYQNGQSADIEKGLNFIEISKVRSFIRELDERITPPPKPEAPKAKVYQKPCGCPSAYPLERIVTDGRIRCSKHGSYERSVTTGEWVPTAKGQLGSEPSGRSGGGLW